MPFLQNPIKTFLLFTHSLSKQYFVKLFFMLDVIFSINIFAQGEWKQYLPEYNMLPNVSMNVIKVDRFNNIWFGAYGYSNIYGEDGGLIKFDRVNWIQYKTTNSNLPDNNITAIAFDHDDNTWIGMRDSGLAIVKNDNITLIKGPLQFIERGWVNNILCDSKGNIWVLYYEGVRYPGGIAKPSALMKYDGENWINFNLDSIEVPEESISSIALDKNDNLYCGSQDKILKYNGASWAQIEVPGDDRRLTVSYLAFDHEGVLWVGTSGFGSVPTLLLYDNGVWTNTAEIYSSGEPSEILFDNDGSTWVSSVHAVDKGLAKYSNGSWQYFNRDNSAIFWDGISTLAIDSTGILWCGTDYSTVCTFDGTNWKYYHSSGGLPSELINKIIIDENNNKWIAADNFGLVKYDGDSWTIYDKSNSDIPFNTVNDIAIAMDKKLWVATGNGLGVYEPATDQWQVYNEENTGFPVDDLTDIEFDSKGRLWGSASSGLLSFNGTEWDIFNSENSILPENLSYYCLGINKKNAICIGGEGLYIYDGGTWVNYNIENSALPNNYIESIAFDSLGNTWVGTENGIVKIKDENWEIFQPGNSNIVGWDATDITVDKENNIWAGFYWNQGISKYDGNSWTHYNTIFDTIQGGVNVLSIVLDNSSNLWIGTTYQGLVEFNEDKIVSIQQESSFLEQNKNEVSIFPNPFNSQTKINFKLKEASNVKITIFAITGELVKVIANSSFPGKENTIHFNADNLASGVYLCAFEILPVSSRQKEIFIKKISLIK